MAVRTKPLEVPFEAIGARGNLSEISRVRASQGQHAQIGKPLEFDRHRGGTQHPLRIESDRSRLSQDGLSMTSAIRLVQSLMGIRCNVGPSSLHGRAYPAEVGKKSHHALGTRLPFILLPGFIVPLVVATHVAIAARLRAGIRPARLSACPR